MTDEYDPRWHVAFALDLLRAAEGEDVPARKRNANLRCAIGRIERALAAGEPAPAAERDGVDARADEDPEGVAD